MNRSFAPLKSASSSKTTPMSMQATEAKIPISKDQHESIQEELLKDAEFAFFFREIEEDKKRLADMMNEIKSNLELISKIAAKKAALQDIQMALARGEVLHYEDQAIWDEGEARIVAELQEKKELDRKMRKEKLEIKTMIERNQNDLQKFCLESLGSSFSFEKSGRYYKIGRGAVDLQQPLGESLREVGMAFRSLLTDVERLRSLKYNDALEIIMRYEKAVGPHHKDLHSIQEVLKQMRDNVEMSRYSWCLAVRCLCDEMLLSDFIRTVDSITTSEEGSQDMGNSLNEQREFFQLMDQGRCRAQMQMKRVKEFNQMRNFFSEEEHQKFGTLVPVVPNTQRNKKQSGNNKRGGQKHNKFQKKPGHFSGEKRPAFKNGNKNDSPQAKRPHKKNKDGFRPVTDQK
ncbi:unnamed protein product [Oikopleura dioica]|uniref:Uncharacterized protein n=1 Tax=Oikopleura dioica TaxID=34765 RepID=E4X8Z6_OIKDI|nr:unnamed protein product [Oikopleura dioica]